VLAPFHVCGPFALGRPFCLMIRALPYRERDGDPCIFELKVEDANVSEKRTVPRACAHRRGLRTRCQRSRGQAQVLDIAAAGTRWLEMAIRARSEDRGRAHQAARRDLAASVPFQRQKTLDILSSETRFPEFGLRSETQKRLGLAQPYLEITLHRNSSSVEPRACHSRVHNRASHDSLLSWRL